MNFLEVGAEIHPLVAEAASVESDLRYEGRIPVVLGAWRVKRADLVLLTGAGVTLWPNPEHYVAVFEVPAEGGWRWGTGEKTRFYWELGGGPDLLFVASTALPLQVDAGLGTWTGLGLRVGSGDIAGTFGIRARGRLGVDTIGGYTVLPDGGFSWQWSPFRASVGLFAAVVL